MLERQRIRTRRIPLEDRGEDVDWWRGRAWMRVLCRAGRMLAQAFYIVGTITIHETKSCTNAQSFPPPLNLHHALPPRPQPRPHLPHRLSRSPRRHYRPRHLYRSQSRVPRFLPAKPPAHRPGQPRLTTKGAIARFASFSAGIYAEGLITLLAREIEAVKADASRALGCAAVAIGAIGVPYHWNIVAQQAVFRAARAAGVPLAGMNVLPRYPRALDEAYDLEACLAEDDFLYLVIDYNRSYLHLLICETALHGGYLVEGQVQLPHLSEDAVAEGEQRQHYERVSGALARFVDLTTAKDPASSTQWILPYRDIKAVLLSGEASLGAMQLIGDALKQTSADVGKDALFNSLDPLYLASVGAARAARSEVDNPQIARDFVSMPDIIPDEPMPS